MDQNLKRARNEYFGGEEAENLDKNSSKAAGKTKLIQVLSVNQTQDQRALNCIDNLVDEHQKVTEQVDTGARQK